MAQALIGRGDERARLERRARRRRGRAWIARARSGEAGAGKTRLTEDVARRDGSARGGDPRLLAVRAPPSPRSAATSAPGPAPSTAAGRSGRTSRCSCPSWDRPSRRTTGPPFRGAALRTGHVSPAPGGDPARRPPVVGRGDARVPRRSRADAGELPLLIVAAYRSDESRARTAAPPAPRPAARPRAGGGRARAAPRGPRPPRWSRSCWATRPRRGSPRRSTSARAACPSSSRSSRRRCARAIACARPRTGSTSTSTPTCPLPQTVRDAVLVHMTQLSEPARAAAEVAAVAGPARRPRPRGGVADEHGLAELLAAGGWSRRSRAARGFATRSRARRSTTTCRGCGAAPFTGASRRRWARGHDRAEIATHWLAARDTRCAPSRRCCRRSPRARQSTPTATPRALGLQALELWPEGERGAGAHRGRRADARARRAGRRPRRGGAGAARGGRGRAAPRARAARWPTPSGVSPDLRAAGGSPAGAGRAAGVAAEAYAANGLPGEAAAERLVVAGDLQSAADHGEAAATARLAGGGGDPRRANGPGRAGDGAPRPSGAASSGTSTRGRRRSAPGSRSRSRTSRTPWSRAR